MTSGAAAVCKFDDDQDIQGVSVGPTNEDIIVTAQEDGVFVRSIVSKVSVGGSRDLYSRCWAQQIAFVTTDPFA